MEYKVKRFKQMILAENQRQNLISRRNPESEVEKHVLDSLAILDFINLTGKSIADVGSGAGFPGMVLAIAKGECQVTLIEADKKKGFFLQQVKDELQLENVEILIDRRLLHNSKTHVL